MFCLETHTQRHRVSIWKLYAFTELVPCGCCCSCCCCCIWSASLQPHCWMLLHTLAIHHACFSGFFFCHKITVSLLVFVVSFLRLVLRFVWLEKCAAIRVSQVVMPEHMNCYLAQISIYTRRMARSNTHQSKVHFCTTTDIVIFRVKNVKVKIIILLEFVLRTPTCAIYFNVTHACKPISLRPIDAVIEKLTFLLYALAMRPLNIRHQNMRRFMVFLFAAVG